MDNHEITLPEHEAHSQHRAQMLAGKIDHMKEDHDMSKPTVNVFQPPSHEGGGLNAMAAIAALGNRNEQSASAFLPALAAMRGHGDGFGMGGGIGAGLVGGIIGGLLFNRRGGGFGDGGDCGGGAGQIIADGALLNGVNGLTASVPTTALQTQNAIQGAIAQLALGTQQGFANVKDSVQASTAANMIAIGGVKDAVQLLATGLAEAICGVNQNVSAQGCQTREAVQNDGDKTRALLVARFQLEDQTRIQELNARVIELQSEGRHREVTASITNTNTAVAAQQQGQQQQQLQALVTGVNSLFPILNGIVQVAHATNSNVIAGNTGAVVTGPQTANPTNVNA